MKKMTLGCVGKKTQPVRNFSFAWLTLVDSDELDLQLAKTYLHGNPAFNPQKCWSDTVLSLFNDAL